MTSTWTTQSNLVGPRGWMVEGSSRAARGRSQGKEQEKEKEEQENDMSSNLYFCEF